MITENIVRNIRLGWSLLERERRQAISQHDILSAAEKALIPAASVKTPDNPEHGSPGGADTSDRVFLLSIGETLQFFSDNADRKPDKLSPCVEASWSWLRSSGEERAFAAIIEKSGKISAGGRRITNLRGGVRPTIFIKL